jgi:hypothetical protein
MLFLKNKNNKRKENRHGANLFNHCGPHTIFGSVPNHSLQPANLEILGSPVPIPYNFSSRASPLFDYAQQPQATLSAHVPSNDKYSPLLSQIHNALMPSNKQCAYLLYSHTSNLFLFHSFFNSTYPSHLTLILSRLGDSLINVLQWRRICA